MKLREHRFLLSDSLETVIEIEPTRNALIGAVKSVLEKYGINIHNDDVLIEKYCYDDRIKWDAYIVTVDGYGVFGFTDGNIID